jgi:superfamily I DNA/RNA helicase
MVEIFDDKITDYRTEISRQDRERFRELHSFLGKFNEEQKKAIISESRRILCVAGAGSGKTTVLTKRIEFLVRYKGVNPEKILAVTFTRKARKEMMKRLMKSGISVKVETFNSFCEKVLKRYEKQIYRKPTRMLSYTSRALMVTNALGNLGMNLNEVIDTYFTESQKENSEFEKLSNSFLSDCFYVLDYFKMKNKELYDFSEEAEDEKEAARIL